MIQKSARVDRLRAELREAEADLKREIRADNRVVREPHPSTETESEPATLPSRILQRINASPSKVFHPDDFADLAGDSPNLASTALFRLAKPTKSGPARIRKVGRAQFQALDRAPPRPANGSGEASTSATDSASVMAFMEGRPGEWLRPAQVTVGLGLDEDRRPAVAASLDRLFKKKVLQKQGGAFCFPRPRHAEVGTS